MNNRICCYINNDKFDQIVPCEKKATFQIWNNDDSSGPYDFTESCDQHISDLLDDTTRFNLVRIPLQIIPRVYALNKDIPGVKSGARFQMSAENPFIYFHGIPISSNIKEEYQVGIICFESKHVENNPEWFTLIEGEYES